MCLVSENSCNNLISMCFPRAPMIRFLLQTVVEFKYMLFQFIFIEPFLLADYFVGSFSCMEYTNCIYRCYLASNCGECCRACKRYHVCHERQACRKCLFFWFLSTFYALLLLFLNWNFCAGYITGSGNRVINTDIYVCCKCYTVHSSR